MYSLIPTFDLINHHFSRTFIYFLFLFTFRHQFYLHVRLDLFEKRLTPTNWDSVAKIVALIAQAEFGDFDPIHTPHNVYLQAANMVTVEDQEKPVDILQKITQEHKNCKGMKTPTAEYWLLKEVSAFDSFGVEMFQTKTQTNITIGVGPHGITMYEKDKEKHVIPFTAIQSASSHRRLFRLSYLCDSNIEKNLEVKLDSSHAASSLYRAITEKHAFYSCETVRTAVTSQFIRDLKGTIVSIFNEDSSLGKKYVFDIRRTCREVYDNARRALYMENKILGQDIMEVHKDILEGGQSKVSFIFFKVINVLTFPVKFRRPTF